jgi:hypothetical protein
MPKSSPRQRKTTGRVMHEFKHGELKSGPGGRAGKVKVAVRPLPSRLKRPVPQNTKAKARTSAISQNPNARKLAVTRINRRVRASRMWVRADGEKAAPLWAERMRRGRRREGANPRERAKVGLEQRRPHQANSARTSEVLSESITIEGPTIRTSSGLA